MVVNKRIPGSKIDLLLAGIDNFLVSYMKINKPPKPIKAPPKLIIMNSGWTPPCKTMEIGINKINNPDTP